MQKQKKTWKFYEQEGEEKEVKMQVRGVISLLDGFCRSLGALTCSISTRAGTIEHKFPIAKCTTIDWHFTEL